MDAPTDAVARALRSLRSAMELIAGGGTSSGQAIGA
jgi:hypothetical protein